MKVPKTSIAADGQYEIRVSERVELPDLGIVLYPGEDDEHLYTVSGELLATINAKVRMSRSLSLVDSPVGEK